MERDRNRATSAPEIGEPPPEDAEREEPRRHRDEEEIDDPFGALVGDEISDDEDEDPRDPDGDEPR